MTRATELLDPETLRRQTLDLLGRTSDAAQTADLPLPDPIVRCRERLIDNHFTVLVAGEAKRGKSTFINALLGRPLLPTDVDVATCQVVRVQHAPTDAFRLRFEDDSSRTIGSDELARHGLQAFLNSHDPRPESQLLRWIEVETPAHFLPAGLTLLDTPGLGTLYADHARITERFVPEADAVLFVLHSDSPIGREEIAFLERLLAVTGDIFFVQTTIDRYSRSHWQSIRERNQQILRERLGSRLSDTTVWPISSANLLTAAQSGDVDYEQISRYRPLRDALDAFLFRVAGCRRTAEALMLMTATLEQGEQILADRAALLTGARDGERRLQTLREQQVDFAFRWDQPGLDRTRLHQRLTQAASDAQQEFWQALQPGCPLELDLRHQIDSLDSLDAARRLGSQLSGRVAETTSRAWREAQGRFQSRSASRLQPLIQAGCSVALDTNSAELTPRHAHGPEVQADPYLQVAVATEQFVQGSVLVGSAGVVLSVVVATSWFPPLALAGALAGRRLGGGAGLVTDGGGAVA